MGDIFNVAKLTNLLRATLCALQGAEFAVDWVRDGKSGSTAMRSAYYAAVLLNPGVAGISGMELLRTARASGNHVPVLLLTEGE